MDSTIAVPGWVALLLILLPMALMWLIVWDTVDDIRYWRARKNREES